MLVVERERGLTLAYGRFSAGLGLWSSKIDFEAIVANELACAMVLRQRRQSLLRPSEAATSTVTSWSVFRAMEGWPKRAYRNPCTLPGMHTQKMRCSTRVLLYEGSTGLAYRSRWPHWKLDPSVGKATQSVAEYMLWHHRSDVHIVHTSASHC